MKSFKNLLFVTSLDAFNDKALFRAKELASNNQAKLTVLQVIEKIPDNLDFSDLNITLDEIERHMREENHRRFAPLKRDLSDKLDVHFDLITGNPHVEVIRRVIGENVDLVIKASDDAYHISAQDLNLLRKCPCPVWLVGSEPRKEYKKIVATVDVDEVYVGQEKEVRRRLNYQILELACQLAVAESAELHIVHAWRAAGESALRGGFLTRSENEATAYVEQVKQMHQQNLQRFIQEFSADVDNGFMDYLLPETHLLKGWPNKVIPSFINHNDVELVVMGTVCRSGMPGFFIGNTAESIFNQTRCSILAVKPDGFLTPVNMHLTES